MSLPQRIARLLSAHKGFLAFFVLMVVFRSAVADWMYVPSGSMNPTIVEGDRILVDKAAYGLRVPFTTRRMTRGSDPQRGDIAIFASPEDGTTLVKRIVGLPGDTIEVRGLALHEPDQHRGVLGDTPDAQQGDGGEPHRHHRAEGMPDAGGPLRLDGE